MQLETALARAKDRSGLSYREIYLRLRDLIGPRETPTIETIRRYHTPGTSKTVRALVVLALLDIYNASLDDLDVAPELIDDVARVRDLVTPAEVSSRCYPRASVLLAAA